MTPARAGRVPIPVKRTLSVLAAAVGAALLLSACSSTGSALAAKVGTTTISRTSVNDDLRAITDNAAVNSMLNKTLLESKVKPTSGGVSRQLATVWLTTLVNQAVVDQYFEKHHLKVTDSERSAARQAAYSSFVDEKTFKELPGWFQKDAISRQERLQAVQATLPPAAAPSDADLQQAFDANKAQLCPSGEAVAQIQATSRAGADAIEAQLAAGADFGTLAQKSSSDAGSAAVGGLVACTSSDQYNQLPAAFRQGADPLQLGQVSPPVQSDLGWHVIKREPFDLANSKLLLTRIIAQQQTRPIQTFIDNQLVRRKIWVDPQYGTVRRSKTAITIIPPQPPKPRSEPAEPDSTTTPAAGATSP